MEQGLFDENVSNIRFIVFDTETTGGTPGKDYVVEVAAIAFDEEFEHRKFQTLIKPVFPMPVDVIAIHGITDKMLVDAPSSREGLSAFFEFLKHSGHPRVLIAHNAKFDVGMIHGRYSDLARFADDISSEIVIDSCALAKCLLPEIKSHSMATLVEFYKLNVGKMHRAEEDVRLLKEIFMRLLASAADKLFNPRAGFRLSDLVSMCGGFFMMNPWEKKIRDKPFQLPLSLQKLEELCSTNEVVQIIYDSAEDYRSITPIQIKHKGMRVFLDAFCHRDEIKKTFRIDKIRKMKIT